MTYNGHMFLFLVLFSFPIFAQVTDASFFPSVRSINPGVVHMRRGGLVSMDYGKKIFDKNHDVPLGGIVGGIQTDIDLTKKTLFATAASRFVSIEALLDQEDGTRKEVINSTTHGKRTSSDDADSTYYGAIFDFRYFGLSYAGANYSYLNKFRVGTPPDLTARDEDKNLSYTNLKLGSAIKIKSLRLGAYVLSQKASGDYTYTFYDPTTGAKGGSEKFPVDISSQGYGVGLGFTLPRLRSEVSFEKLYGYDFDLSSDYPIEQNEPTDSSRVSFVAEVKFSFMSLGFRFRSIKGNYIDLEDVISSNLLYDQTGPNDVRTETNFNFSFGDSKGFSPSLFYTQSTLNTDEKSPVFDNGLKFKAVTKSQAYGVNLSYRF